LGALVDNEIDTYQKRKKKEKKRKLDKLERKYIDCTASGD
jgi:hypothetical protein